MKKITRNTANGAIRGLQDGDVLTFRGIRYAYAERWKYPKMCGAWEGEYDATEFGAACTQLRTFNDETVKQPEPFYYREFRKGEHYTYDEDCLFLNIWMPADAQNADVIVYIHGGAFLGGCGNEKHMDGTAYAKRGIVFVSLNYRLGPLGFLCDPKLKEESGHTGNYGLFDQLAALKWIHENIVDYGGNPGKVTITSQSAGAMSTTMHCLSPLSRPYFNAAYLASGGGIGRSFAHVGKAEDSYAFWGKITAMLGKDPDEWRRRSTKEVYDAFFKGMDQTLMDHCCPHVDGVLIPEDPETAAVNGKMADIPYLLSTNSEDMAPEALHPMAYEWALLCAKHNHHPVYCFRFERQLPGDDSGAFHSAELWYTLGSLHKCWRPFTEWDERLSDALVSSVIAFAKTGSPQNPAVPAWPAVKADDHRMMIFGDGSIQMDEADGLGSL